MVAEVLSRCPAFLAGREIRLADNQSWTFPAPLEDVEFIVEDEAEYVGLIQAICEAEDRSDRLMAELALAMFLFGLNYQVDPADLEFLFTFPPGSRELTDSQRAFQLLAQDHLRHRYGQGNLPSPTPVVSEPWRPSGVRTLAWLRGFWPRRGWFVSSRRGQAMP